MSYNVMSASSRKIDFDVILYTYSEDEKEEEIIYSAQTEVPMVAATRSGNPYHKNYNEQTTKPSQLPHPELLGQPVKLTTKKQKEKEPHSE